MKQDIGEVLINFINNNQTNNWDAIFKALLIFLGVFWLSICLWVFGDARSRYDKFIVAILITLFVLVFNIPALIIYVILRPEHTREEINLIAGASLSRQLLPIDLEQGLLSSGNSFKMHFAINFTPSLENGTPKMNFTVEKLEGLPLSEEIVNQKTLAENVEVIELGKKEEVVQENSKEKNSKTEMNKESEQTLTKKDELIVQDNNPKKVGIKEKVKNLLAKVYSFERNTYGKLKSIKLPKIKLKPSFSFFTRFRDSIKKRISFKRVTKPSEIILPTKQTKQESSEKLAKSKKKKKNRSRRR